jgi:dTDP-4-amino-4,6-dideoxygalactose transaminase
MPVQAMSATDTARTIPLVDVRAQYEELRQDIDAAIKRVIDAAAFILGPEVASFESAFARFVGSPEAVGVASGTAALHLALLACKVGPGDEVITTPHTFIATAEAISQTGATPVFADIDPETFTIDPAAVERAITPRTRAIMPVHLYGHPANMTPLLELAASRSIWVVEDAAQAHGAEFEGRPCGSIGALAGFSFYPGKNLGAFGDAGAVTGTDQAALRRVRKLRDHGRTTKYEHDEIGFGERLDGLQAAILSVKLARLEAWNDARRRVARAYDELLADAPVVLPQRQPWATHAYHLYVIRAPRRDDLLAALDRAGIKAGVHYPIPLHRQPAYRHLEAGPFPETERAAAEVLSLPMHPHLSTTEIERVAETVKAFYRA